MPRHFVFGPAAKRYPHRLKSVEHRLLVIEALLVVPLLIHLGEKLYYNLVKRRILRWRGYNIGKDRIFVDYKDILERAISTGLFTVAAILGDQYLAHKPLDYHAAVAAGIATALSVLKNYIKQHRSLPKGPEEATLIPPLDAAQEGPDADRP